MDRTIDGQIVRAFELAYAANAVLDQQTVKDATPEGRDARELLKSGPYGSIPNAQASELRPA